MWRSSSALKDMNVNEMRMEREMAGVRRELAELREMAGVRRELAELREEVREERPPRG
jgi:hypothetical protein